ncbi:MAG: hypothetical protein QOH73_691, partial [Gaiellaceae bacterium]|nr:hypothetical protein [Gaiellaceae bacterium]
MILDNGVIRTLDPQLPLSRALAVAGERFAGGVGVHETALASPELVDLRGRCVLPGFTDAHVHFPSWAIARREVRLFDAHSVDEAVQRVHAAARGVTPGELLRGIGWREGLWREDDRPTRQSLDEAVPDIAVALRSHDGHSLWLNSVALARANGNLAVPGGVVEVDDDGEPSGILREESAWHYQTEHVEPGHDEALEAVRDALPVAAAAGVTAIHDKDGGRRAPALFAALRETGELTLRVWQSVPAEDFEEHLENAPAAD